MEDETSLGKDLKLNFQPYFYEGKIFYKAEISDISVARSGDLEIVSGFDNLRQAIIMRLSISKGELEDLGHPTYGSRLFELFGQPNCERTREEIKRIVVECLNQEPRIKEILSVSTRVMPSDPDSLEIEISVLPIGGNVPLNIIYPFNLEVG
jgi:phage baseplate assembly protein W